MYGGQSYSHVIDREVKSAVAVVVVWCEASVDSRWVVAEATIAFNAQKLVPIRVADVEPPTPFNTLHALEFSAWKGERSGTAFTELVRAIEGLRRGRERAPVSAEAAEVAFWQTIHNSSDPDDFGLYVQRFPNGVFADLARKRVTSLANRESKIEPPTAAQLPPPSAPLDANVGATLYAEALRMLETGERVSNIAKLLRGAVKAGNPFAAFRLAQLIGNGEAAPANFGEETELLKFAADRGSALAQARLGVLYEKGLGVDANQAEARRWYEIASKQNENWIARDLAITGLRRISGTNR